MKYSGESNLKRLEMGSQKSIHSFRRSKINDTLIDNAVNSAFWNGGQNFQQICVIS